METDLILVIVAAVVCFVLIVYRTGYRLTRNCNQHSSCPRTWHQDDVWMALAIIPLIARTVCMTMYTELNNKHPKTRSEWIVATKLLIPARLAYALFEWCLKLCIVCFYIRLGAGSTHMKKSSKITFWFIIACFVGIVFATLLECRPLSLFWEYKPPHSIKCQKALANLVTMAATNVLTDIIIIILPIPMLWKMTLSTAKKIQLTLLFSVGIFVIGITIARLIMVMDDGIAQSMRSLWASIEIMMSCIVANFSFLYAQFKEIKGGHFSSQASKIGTDRQTSIRSNPDFYHKLADVKREFNYNWGSDKILVTHEIERRTDSFSEV